MSKAPSRRPGFPICKPFFLCFLVLSVCCVTGCRVVYRTLLGVNVQPKWMTDEKVAREFERKGVPTDQAFVLDTASYDRAVRTRYKDEVKRIYPKGPENKDDSVVVKGMWKHTADDLQPVQVRYFDAGGRSIFKLVNCYLDPPIPMRWNVEGAFDHFPPQPIAALRAVEDDSLSFFLEHMHHLDGSSVVQSSLPEADYYVVVFFNRFMVRPSRKLLRTVRRYHKRHPSENLHVLYVHNHNAQIWGMMGPEQREAAKEVLAGRDAAK